MGDVINKIKIKIKIKTVNFKEILFVLHTVLFFLQSDIPTYEVEFSKKHSNPMESGFGRLLLIF